jgi:hypothetical protein
MLTPKSDVVARPSVQSIDKGICERWRFKISEISDTVLYEIVIDRLG